MEKSVRVRRVDLVHDDLDPALFELVPEAVGGALREGVVHRGDGDRLGPLCFGKREQVVREVVVVVVRDRGGRVEEVVEALLEDLLRRAGRLDEEHAVFLGDARRGNDESGRERAEHEVDAVLRDQRLVVRDHAVGVGLVVEDLQLDLASEEAAVLVDDVAPGLIAPLDTLAGFGEVAGERQRDADDDRIVGSTPLRLIAGGRAGRNRERGDRQRSDRCRDPSTVSGCSHPSLLRHRSESAFVSASATIVGPKNEEQPTSQSALILLHKGEVS